MSKLEIAPYRASALAIEPISLDLIPDCGEEETARLNKEMSAIHEERWRLVSKASKRAFLKVFIPSFVAAVIANVLLGFVDGIDLEGRFAIVLIGICIPAMITLIVSWRWEAQAKSSEKFKALGARLEELQDGLNRLESLDRLTGKRQRAGELRKEVDLFNSDLKRQDVSRLTNGDHLLIRARRGELMKKIGLFRETALGLPEPAEPLQLSPKSDT